MDDDPVYEVMATRWEHGYELYVAGVGATQTDDRDGTPAEEMVRDYLHLLLDRPADSFKVQIRYPDDRAVDGPGLEQRDRQS